MASAAGNEFVRTLDFRTEYGERVWTHEDITAGLTPALYALTFFPSQEEILRRMEEFSLTRDGPGRYDDVSSQVLDPSFQCQITHCVPSYPVVVGGDNIYEYQMIRCYFHCCARSHFSSDELARRERIVACPMRIMTTTLSKPVKTRGEADALFDSWCKSPSDDWQRRFEATIHSAR